MSKLKTLKGALQSLQEAMWGNKESRALVPINPQVDEGTAILSPDGKEAFDLERRVFLGRSADAAASPMIRSMFPRGALSALSRVVQDSAGPGLDVERILAKLEETAPRYWADNPRGIPDREYHWNGGIGPNANMLAGPNTERFRNWVAQSTGLNPNEFRSKFADISVDDLAHSSRFLTGENRAAQALVKSMAKPGNLNKIPVSGPEGWMQRKPKFWYDYYRDMAKEHAGIQGHEDLIRDLDRPTRWDSKLLSISEEIPHGPGAQEDLGSLYSPSGPRYQGDPRPGQNLTPLQRVRLRQVLSPGIDTNFYRFQNDRIARTMSDPDPKVRELWRRMWRHFAEDSDEGYLSQYSKGILKSHDK